MDSPPRSRFIRFIQGFATAQYAIVVLAVAAAIGLRLTFEPLLGANTPYITFFAAVVVVRHLCGRGPALATSALGFLCAWYFFLEPRYSFTLGGPAALFGLGLFAAIAVAISLLEAPRGLRSREGAPDRLEPARMALAGAPLVRRLAIFTGAALALGILAALLWSGLQRSVDADRMVEHTYQVLNAASSVRSYMERAQTSQRGYLLTGSDQYLEPYQSAVRSERQARATLRRLTADNPAEQARLDEFDRLLQIRLGMLAGAIEVRRQQGMAAVADLVRANWGKEQGNQLRAILDALDDDERQLLHSRTMAAGRADSRTRWTLGLGSGSLVLLLMLAGAGIERQIQQRHRAEKVLTRQAWLIDLSRDAVITTDGNRVITGWNSGAQEMYGWTEKEAVGQTLHELLHTSSSIPIAEVDRILAREGRWDGELAHTRRDGRQIAVESRQVFQRDDTGRPAGYLEINRDITDRKLAEMKLRESEARLRSLGDNLPEAAIYRYRLDTNGKPHVDFISAGIERLTGVPAAEFMADAATVERSIVPEDRGRLRATIALSRERLTRFEEEIRHRHRTTGEIRWSILRSTPTRNPDGSTIWDGIELDITDRRRMDEALRLSEEKFAKAFAINPAAVVITRLKDGLFIEVNETWQAMMGRTRDEVIGRAVGDLAIWPASGDRDRFAGELREKGSLHGWEQTFLRKSGEQLATLLSASILTIAGEEVVISTLLDITERKRTEEALNLSEERFAKAFATNPAALAITRIKDGLIIDVNETWQAMMGHTRDDAIGRTTMNLHTWPTSAARGRYARELKERRSLHGREETLLRSSGERFTALMSASVLAIDGEEVAISAWLDISDRKKAEEALRESEAQFRALANAIPQLCWMANADGWIFWYNDRWYRYTGTTPDQMQGWGWQSVHDPEALPKVLERWKGSIASGEPFDMVFPLRGADGAFRPFLTRVMPVRDQDGKIAKWFGTNTDISEQRKTEEALKESRAKLEAALASMTEAVFISDAEGRFIHLNEAFATFHRFRDMEECSRTFAEYPAILDVLLADGTPAPLDMWAVPRALRGEAATNAEYTLRRKDTGESWIGSYSFGPIRGPDGRIAGSVVVARDITDRRRAEEEIRRLNAELGKRVLERTAELESANKELEAFAYSVSHDLRAPLRGIDGWTLALIEDFCGQCEKLNGKGRGYLDRVRSETQRMGHLIDDLLQLSRITRAEMHRDAVDLSRAAETIAARLREAHPRRCLEFAIRPGLKAFGDARLLEVALTNLLDNAVKFTGSRTPARIEFETVEREGKTAFVVRDNGVGFDMAYAGALFGAFQRLHSDAEFPGTGIGLATVQRVIRRHGGRIWAEAAPDRGASFYFTIEGEK